MNQPSLLTTAIQVAALCVEKNAAYGDSIPRAVAMLQILYPAGISPSQYLDALFAARDFEKRCRLVHDSDPHGEDPRLDLAGYALVRLNHQQRLTVEKENANPCSINVPAPAATPSPSEATASAARIAAKASTPPASMKLGSSFERVRSAARPAASNTPSKRTRR